MINASVRSINYIKVTGGIWMLIHPPFEVDVMSNLFTLIQIENYKSYVLFKMFRLLSNALD